MLEKLEAMILATPMAEWLAVITAILYVILVARENIWGWFFGGISSALFVYLCYYHWNLQLETILNVFYLIMAFYGGYEWKFGKRKSQELHIVSHTLKQLSPGILICLIFFPIAGWIFQNYTTSSFTYLDSFTTVFSFWATILVARKVLESWIVWVIIDFASIFLYWSRDAYLTALLFIVYTIIAAIAWVQWKKLMPVKA